MPEPIGELAVRIVADTEGLSAGLTKVRAEAQRFGQSVSGTSGNLNRFQTSINSLTGSLGGLAKGFVAIAAARKLVGFAEESVKAFAAEQLQVQRLDLQLKAFSGTVGLTIRQLEGFTEALSESTGVADDQIRAAEQIALKFGLVGSQMEDLTKLAVDMGQNLGRDIPGVMSQLTRTLEHPTESLRLMKREMHISAETEALVKDLDAGGRRAEAAAVLVDDLKRTYQGAAETLRSTSLDIKFDAFKNALDNIVEDTGEIVSGWLQIPTLIDTGTTALQGFHHWLNMSVTERAKLEKELEDLGFLPSQPLIGQPAATPIDVDAISSGKASAGIATTAKVTIDLSDAMAKAKQSAKDLSDAEADAQRQADAYRDSLEALHFQLSTIGLTYGDLAAAQKAHELFGANWKDHLDDSAVGLARLNSQLETSLGLAQDFGQHFVDVLLDGKNAADALNDALKDIARQVLQMAIQKSIGAAFNLLTGAAGAGTVQIPLPTPRPTTKFSSGGFVGSTPRPVWGGEKLAYDEYPAILHAGERVIPAGGQSSISGEQMTRFFGGVPKLQSGFNAGAAAAGAYTAGDTGATGSWSQVSGGGGNATLSALLASQYSGRGGGGGTISLGSRGTGGGTVTLPRLRPITGVPRERIIGTPLPPILSNFGMPTDLVPFGSDWTRMWWAPSYRPLPGGETGGENFTFQPVTDWWHPMSLLPPSDWPTTAPVFPDMGTGPFRGGHGAYFPDMGAGSFAGGHGGFFGGTPSLQPGMSAPTFGVFNKAGGVFYPPGAEPIYGGTGNLNYVDPYGAVHTDPRTRDRGRSGLGPGGRVTGYHTGGWVGSTPIAIWRKAPRLHDGLGYDEYPAILQAGERVIPRGGESGGSKVSVTVINNANANVDVQEQRDGDNVKLDIVIDELVAGKMRDGGSRIARTMQTMGSRAVPVRR